MKSNRCIPAFLVLSFFILFSCQRSGSNGSKPVAPPALNVLTADEKTEGWELLFDGSSLTGWKRYNSDTIGPLWSVKDGAIVCDGKGLSEGTAKVGGSLTTLKQYGNFELDLEWKISEGGNSGILYHVVEDKKYKHDYETGPEFQVMDDAGWKGDKLRDAQKAGSNYDMYPAPDDKRLLPIGEWNTVRLIYKDGHVEHWLNDKKVVSFEEGTEDYNARYKKSKWVGYPDWNKVKTGHISLQDHGAIVSYRNIKLKAL